MTSWQQVTAQAPELAERVATLFGAHKHHTMATLRRDGAPRISGTEVRIEDGELVLGMMPGTRRAADLRHDPRVALHTHTIDPDEGDPAGPWPGDAKVGGLAVALSPAGREPAGAEWFRIDVHTVALTRLGTPADHLVVEWWTPEGGYASRRR